MSRTRVIAVVSEAADGKGLPEGISVTADQYLEGGEAHTEPGAVVVNLCRSWKYGSKGYYVSLLADARGQLPIPSVDVSEAFGDAYALFRALQEAGVSTVDPEEMRARRRSAARSSAPVEEESDEDEAPRALPVPIVRVQEEGGWACRPASGEEAAETLVFLGSAADARFRNTALAVYREWPAPVLRLQLVREDGEWKVTAVAPVPPHRLEEDDRRQLCEALADQKRIVRRGREAPREERRASIAVLVDPDDVFSPSSPETLDRLERIAQRMNVHVRRIGLDELHKLPEYDALFIRALTGVSEPAFQFALRAEALGMPVVDDSQSIIRCGNKVFLEELLRRESVATPRTRIVTAHMAQTLGQTIIIENVVGAGGTTDVEARIFARHLPRHLPGDPTVIAVGALLRNHAKSATRRPPEEVVSWAEARLRQAKATLKKIPEDEVAERLENGRKHLAKRLKKKLKRLEHGELRVDGPHRRAEPLPAVEVLWTPLPGGPGSAEVPDALQPTAAAKVELGESLLKRIQGVLATQESKYIMLNAAGESLQRRNPQLPGAEGPTDVRWLTGSRS